MHILNTLILFTLVVRVLSAEENPTSGIPMQNLQSHNNVHSPAHSHHEEPPPKYSDDHSRGNSTTPASHSGAEQPHNSEPPPPYSELTGASSSQQHSDDHSRLPTVPSPVHPAAHPLSLDVESLAHLDPPPSYSNALSRQPSYWPRPSRHDLPSNSVDARTYMLATCAACIVVVGGGLIALGVILGTHHGKGPQFFRKEPRSVDPMEETNCRCDPNKSKIVSSPVAQSLTAEGPSKDPKDPKNGKVESTSGVHGKRDVVKSTYRRRIGSWNDADELP